MYIYLIVIIIKYYEFLKKKEKISKKIKKRQSFNNEFKKTEK